MMSRSRNASLIAQLVSVVIALLVGTAAAYLILFSLIARKTFFERLKREGTSLSKTIAAGSGYYVDFRLEANLRDIAQSLLLNRSVDYVEFLDGDGKLLAQSDASKRPAALGTSARPARRRDPVFGAPVADTPADARALDRLGVASRPELARVSEDAIVTRASRARTWRISGNRRSWEHCGS